MNRVLLITMPWQRITMPSVALGTLKSILQQYGIECDCSYMNIRFGAKIGVHLYLKVSELADGRFLDGERLFSPFVFTTNGKLPQPEKRYWIYSLPASLKEKILTQQEYERIHKIIPEFLDECMDAILWDNYDIVGFTTVFEQNVPSLALAKRIKEKYPSKIILFGGANCEGEMGIALHENFPWIDYVVVGEADNNIVPLIEAIRNGRNIQDIPGVAYRDQSGKTNIKEFSSPVKDMDSIPIPDYDDYFSKFELYNLDLPVQIPLESSRGCWWGQKHPCTFCGLNRLGMTFRSKSSQRVLQEIIELSSRHKVLDFIATDNILPIAFMKELLPSLSELRKQYDFSIGYEIKSNLTKEQIKNLAAAGFYVQPGIESFSDHLLKLMDKGVTGIQQIQTLKWLMEYNVKVHYGILHSFPFEKAEDYIEMSKILPFISHLIPPGYCTPIQIHRFSPYFDHPGRYGIRNIRPFISYWGIYPFGQETIAKLAYMFDFEVEYAEPGLLEARQACIKGITEWQQGWKPDLLTFKSGPGFITIHDQRDSRDVVRTLNKRESKIYSFCDAYQSYKQILGKFEREMTNAEIDAILQSMVEDKLMYRDYNNRIISLAISKS